MFQSITWWKHTTVAWPVDKMMAWAKRIYILMIKVKKLFLLFRWWCFRKEVESMFSVFLLSYGNARESLGGLEKALETLTYGSCSHSISLSPKLPLMFLWLERNMVHIHVFFLKCTGCSRTHTTAHNVWVKHVRFLWGYYSPWILLHTAQLKII